MLIDICHITLKMVKFKCYKDDLQMADISRMSSDRPNYNFPADEKPSVPTQPRFCKIS